MICRGICCLILAAAVALAQQERNFVACPIVRDTKTVPCFLAEYDGELYFLGTQSGTAVPQLKHEVLVEGRVAQGPRVCGGIPLQPVAISVIKEVNLACNTILPAEPGIEAPPIAPARPQAGAPAVTGQHEFTILYPFNDDRLEASGITTATEAATYAKRIGASKITITGYRSGTLLSNGNSLTEKSGIAETRAQNIKTLLLGLGFPNVSATWKDDPDQPAGPSRRRVTILVTP